MIRVSFLCLFCRNDGNKGSYFAVTDIFLVDTKQYNKCI